MHIAAYVLMEWTLPGFPVRVAMAKKIKAYEGCKD